MRRLDAIVLILGIVAAICWTVVSGKDGFKGSNAIIVARSMAVTSTIEGQVDNEPPMVGARVDTEGLLVSIHNRRIDQGRLVEFESDIDFLHLEIDNLELQQDQLAQLLSDYQQKATAHSDWMLSDLKLQDVEKAKQLQIAENTRQLRSDKLNRAAQLYSGQHTSNANLTATQLEASIANNQVELTQANRQRNRLLLRSVTDNGVFFDNGDAGYWAKMADAITLRLLDNSTQLSSLKAQLARAGLQAEVEKSRIGSSIREEHRAPFDGLVNATYVNEGTKVNIGTSLLQLLDCANPIVIVPIPDRRIGDFSVGMKVSVYPIDSDDMLPGSISYISSGLLIGHDQTLLVQEDLTLSGVHAVVNFSQRLDLNNSSLNCEAAHQAVVVIHTESLYDSAKTWIAAIW